MCSNTPGNLLVPSGLVGQMGLCIQREKRVWAQFHLAVPRMRRESCQMGMLGLSTARTRPPCPSQGPGKNWRLRQRIRTSVCWVSVSKVPQCCVIKNTCLKSILALKTRCLHCVQLNKQISQGHMMGQLWPGLSLLLLHMICLCEKVNVWLQLGDKFLLKPVITCSLCGVRERLSLVPMGLDGFWFRLNFCVEDRTCHELGKQHLHQQ